MKKRAVRLFPFSLNAVYFVAFETSRANVFVDDGTVCLFIGNFLYVNLERSSRSALGMAYVVAGQLTLTANTANSGHIDTPPRILF